MAITPPTRLTDATAVLARLATAAYISVPLPHVMENTLKRWMAKWLTPFPSEPNWIHDIEHGDLQVRICEYDKACGHQGYAVELAGLNKEEDRWVGLAFVGAEDLQGSISLLQEAKAFIDDPVATPVGK